MFPVEQILVEHGISGQMGQNSGAIAGVAHLVFYLSWMIPIVSSMFKMNLLVIKLQQWPGRCAKVILAFISTKRMISSVFCFLIITSYVNGFEAQGSDTNQDNQTVNNHKISAKSLKVTYLLNCGFLIETGSKKLLFDLRSPKTDFEKEALLKVYDLLYNNKAPFDDITAVFISHAHSDHCGFAGIAEYLKKNGKIKLYSTVGTKDEIQKANPETFNQIQNNIITVDPYDSGIIEKSIEGIHVEFLGLYHSGAQLANFKNLAFIIDIEGTKIFYISDSPFDLEKNFEVIKEWGDRKEKIDLMFCHNFWLYENKLNKTGVGVIKQYINPAKIIAMHIYDDEFEAKEEEVKSTFSDAIFFRHCMETKIINKNQ